MILIFTNFVSKLQTFILTYKSSMSWTGLKGTINILPQGQNSPQYSYVQCGWSSSAVSSIVSGFSSTHPCWRFYKKHTGPISTPNSWFGPPMSTGAISTIGSLAVFCVLYSNTVLPQLPFACCKRQIEVQWVTYWMKNNTMKSNTSKWNWYTLF